MPYTETTEGVRLFYRDWGAGEPVVFIAGWALSGEMWEYQMTRLADSDLRCIAYDPRGSGHSDDPGDGYDYDTLADDLAAVMERLDLRGATLVSHSMAAGVIVRYLSRHGAGRIARAALVAAMTPFALKTQDNPTGIPQSVFDDMIAGIHADRPGYLATMAASFFNLPVMGLSPQIAHWGVKIALQASPRACVELLRRYPQTDFRPELAAVTVPALLIHGDADPTAPLDVTARRTASAIPGALLKIYEGGPHGLFITHKDRLNVDLLTFIQGHRPA